ncbi:MAG: putative 2OG-Fe(II) oxygenase, partial [Planctomycetota bacterium]|nr:putative 2OG-Fe(II) oxygenase [Planctomycetota bacterium]
MDIQTWFPLAVATTELSPSASATKAMLVELEPYISESKFQFRHGFAWTGDVNNCMDLHLRTSFSWLRQRVEEETHRYVMALGGDMERLQLYFQSSWPVLSRSEETVSSHTHMTASLSAVYYLQIPEGPGGSLVFENTQSP